LPSWLSGWSYRKSHEIQGSTAGAVSDYQMKVVVHKGTGTDDGENVYCNNHCRDDFGDIRFTDVNGNELPYWMEEKVDGDYAVFWVKVPSIPASPNTATIYCYTPDTEVLTERGWINLKDFVEKRLNLKVATLNPKTDKVEYYYPLAYVKLLHKGKIVHFSGKFYDLKVTPEHRMWYKTRWDSRWRFGIASEIPSIAKFRRDFPYQGQEQKYFILPEYSREWTGGNGAKRRFYKPPRKIPMDDWLRFFGIYIAEGSLRGTNTIVISQQNSKNVETIKSWIESLGYKAYYTGREFLIYDVQLYSYLKQFGHAEDKFIPSELKTLSKRQLRILFDTLMLGDGYEREYGTTSKRLADDFQEIALKIGYTASVTQNNQGLYTVYLGHTSEAQFRTKNFEDYEGYVYCLIVSNHLLYVRRNGKALWSGNCYYGKSDAMTTSNGDNTFLLFDHFSGNYLDTTKWEVADHDPGGSHSVADSLLTIHGGASPSGWAHEAIASLSTFGHGHAFMAKVSDVTNSGQDVDCALGLGAKDDANSAFYSKHGVFFDWWLYNDARRHSAWLDPDHKTFVSITFNAGDVITISYCSGSTKRWINHVYDGEITTNVPSGTYPFLMWVGFSGDHGTLKVDWVAIRKYVDPEPSHGAWGSEEGYVVVPLSVLVSNESLDKSRGIAGETVTYTATVQDENGNALPSTFKVTLKIDDTILIQDQPLTSDVYNPTTKTLTLQWTVPTMNTFHTVKLVWSEQTVNATAYSAGESSGVQFEVIPISPEQFNILVVTLISVAIIYPIQTAREYIEEER